MKTKSILLFLVLSAIAFAVLSKCSGKKDEETHEQEEISGDEHDTYEVSEPQYQVNATFQQQLAALFTSYLALKDAFIGSDAEKVRTAATETNTALSKVDMKLLTGAAHNDWMTYLTAIGTSLNDIQAGADIEAQRKSFSILSDNLYKSIKAFGLGGKVAFYEYCPMAFNNEGGYWLSDNDEIRNPYFGKKMLTCGEVKEKLK